MAFLRHRVGDLLQDRYEVRSLLGSGAFGTVYGCRDTELNLPLAVKELHVLDDAAHPGQRQAALRAFREEALHLSRLRHPNIVSGHYQPHNGEWHVCPVCGLAQPGSSCPEHGTVLQLVTSRHYLVMEYLAGPDLMQLLERSGGGVPWPEVLRLAREVAAALAHLHARGYVHRDVKPENARLREAGGQAVLLDFGIASVGADAPGERYSTRVQRHTQAGGTPGYAPQSPQEQVTPDARSDVHALGMTLYHLLTNLDPTLPQDLEQMREGTPEEFAHDLPPRFAELITQCIAFDPAQRPQDGTALLAELEEVDREGDPEEEEEEVSEAAAAKEELAAQGQRVAYPTVARSAVAPAVPFLFRPGVTITTVAQLLPLLDHFPQEAARHLSSGELEHWLFSSHEIALAESARALRAQYRHHTARGLEAFAQAAGLAPPQVEGVPEVLDFGALGPEKQRTINLMLVNPGRGLAFGRIQASLGAVSTPGEWEGNRVKVSVTFDSFRLRPGKYAGHLQLQTLTGITELPIAARVHGPSGLPAFLTVVVSSALGMAAGGIMRAAPAAMAGLRLSGHWLHHAPAWWPFAPFFGLVAGAVLLAWTVLAAAWWRSCNVGVAGFGLAVAAAIAGAAGGNRFALAADEALRPHFIGLVAQFAPAGWMAVGGMLGALLGTVHRPKDLFSRRILAIGLGWFAAAALFAVALFGVGANVHR